MNDDGRAVTIWRDGRWKRWSLKEAAAAEHDPDWCGTIPHKFFSDIQVERMKRHVLKHNTRKT